jgi:hypothetical protein
VLLASMDELSIRCVAWGILKGFLASNRQDQKFRHQASARWKHDWSVSRNGSIAVEPLHLETSNYELGWVR